MTLLRFLQTAVLASTFLGASFAHATASAELGRGDALGYGRFEARIRFAPEDGVVSSFFLWKNGSEMDGVYWNELDFEKVGVSCELQTNSIYGSPEVGHEQEHGADVTALDLCGSYHTYALEWLPESITWSIDGTVIRTDTGADAEAYATNATEGLQMRFNVWPGDASFGGPFSEAVLPVHQYILWARHSAYTPAAGPDGSDFTLTFEEEFDAEPSGWDFGNWDSPLGHSTHTADNVTFTGGAAVLSLTTDAMLGFDGVVPTDDEGLGGQGPGTGGSSAGGSSGSGGAAAGGTGTATGGTGTAAGGTGTGGTPMFGGLVPGPACGCSVPGRDRVTAFGGAPLLLLGAWLLRRRTSRRLSAQPR